MTRPLSQNALKEKIRKEICQNIYLDDQLDILITAEDLGGKLIFSQEKDLDIHYNYTETFNMILRVFAFGEENEVILYQVSGKATLADDVKEGSAEELLAEAYQNSLWQSVNIAAYQHMQKQQNPAEQTLH